MAKAKAVAASEGLAAEGTGTIVANGDTGAVEGQNGDAGGDAGTVEGQAGDAGGDADTGEGQIGDAGGDASAGEGQIGDGGGDAGAGESLSGDVGKDLDGMFLPEEILVRSVSLNGRWRAGLRFGPRFEPVKVADLTEDQITAICSDSQLIVKTGE